MRAQGSTRAMTASAHALRAALVAAVLCLATLSHAQEPVLSMAVGDAVELGVWGNPSAFTVELDVYPTSTGYIWSSGTTTPSGCAVVTADAAHAVECVLVDSSTAPSAQLTLHAPLQLSVWQHIALTFDYAEGTAMLLVDGVQGDVRRHTATIFPATVELGDVHLGRLGDASASGEYADVRMWTAARTRHLLQAHRHERLRSGGDTLAHYFPLRGDFGHGAIDFATGGTGTLVGAPVYADASGVFALTTNDCTHAYAMAYNCAPSLVLTESTLTLDVGDALSETAWVTVGDDAGETVTTSLAVTARGLFAAGPTLAGGDLALTVGDVPGVSVVRVYATDDGPPPTTHALYDGTNFGDVGVTFGEHADFDVTSAITVDAWVRLDAGAPVSRTVLAKPGAYSLSINLSGQLEWSNGAETLTSTVTVPTGEWTYIAAVQDGNTACLYVNDRAVVGTQTAPSVNSADVHLGAPAGCSGGTCTALVGALDEVTLLANALTPLQIEERRFGVWSRTALVAAGYDVRLHINFEDVLLSTNIHDAAHTGVLRALTTTTVHTHLWSVASAALRIATITVSTANTNPAPVLSIGAPQMSVVDDFGTERSVENFASAASAQGVTYAVSNDNNGMFDAQPDIAEADGTLTWTRAPVAGADDVATVDVTASSADVVRAFADPAGLTSLVFNDGALGALDLHTHAPDGLAVEAVLAAPYQAGTIVLLGDPVSVSVPSLLVRVSAALTVQLVWGSETHDFLCTPLSAATHHVVVSVDRGAGVAHLFLDGTLACSTTLDSTMTAVPSDANLALFGATKLAADTNEDRYTGLCEYVALWDRALTQDDVGARHTLAHGGLDAASANVVLLAVLNSEGTAIEDASATAAVPLAAGTESAVDVTMVAGKTSAVQSFTITSTPVADGAEGDVHVQTSRRFLRVRVAGDVGTGPYEVAVGTHDAPEETLPFTATTLSGDQMVIDFAGALLTPEREYRVTVRNSAANTFSTSGVFVSENANGGCETIEPVSVFTTRAQGTKPAKVDIAWDDATKSIKVAVDVAYTHEEGAWVVDFVPWDATTRSLDVPTNCENRAAAAFVDRPFAEWWSHADRPRDSTLNSASFLPFDATGSLYTAAPHETDCHLVSYTADLSATALEACRAADGSTPSVDFAEVPGTSLTMSGSVHVTYVRPQVDDATGGSAGTPLTTAWEYPFTITLTTSVDALATATSEELVHLRPVTVETQLDADLHNRLYLLLSTTSVEPMTLPQISQFPAAVGVHNPVIVEGAVEGSSQTWLVTTDYHTDDTFDYSGQWHFSWTRGATTVAGVLDLSWAHHGTTVHGRSTETELLFFTDAAYSQALVGDVHSGTRIYIEYGLIEEYADTSLDIVDAWVCCPGPTGPTALTRENGCATPGNGISEVQQLVSSGVAVDAEYFHPEVYNDGIPGVVHPPTTTGMSFDALPLATRTRTCFVEIYGGLESTAKRSAPSRKEAAERWVNANTNSKESTRTKTTGEAARGVATASAVGVQPGSQGPVRHMGKATVRGGDSKRNGGGVTGLRVRADEQASALASSIKWVRHVAPATTHRPTHAWMWAGVGVLVVAVAAVALQRRRAHRSVYSWKNV